jgi:hypothetical protein
MVSQEYGEKLPGIVQLKSVNDYSFLSFFLSSIEKPIPSKPFGSAFLSEP